MGTYDIDSFRIKLIQKITGLQKLQKGMYTGNPDLLNIGKALNAKGTYLQKMGYRIESIEKQKTETKERDS